MVRVLRAKVQRLPYETDDRQLDRCLFSGTRRSELPASPTTRAAQARRIAWFGLATVVENMTP